MKLPVRELGTGSKVPCSLFFNTPVRLVQDYITEFDFEHK